MMKNIIKKNDHFNKKSFWALNTFLQRKNNLSRMINLVLNLSYKYHKYPVSNTLRYKLKTNIKNVFTYKWKTYSHKIIKKGENCSYTKPNGFKPHVYKRCAIFVGYSSDGTIPEYDVYYLKELKKVCDSIIFIMDNAIMKKEIKKIENLVDHAEFRRHGSYDFGSWRKGIIYLKEHQLLNSFDNLILANDSCYGPIYSFDVLLQRMKETKADFWGLVDSYDTQYHILSFFYYFTKKVFTDPDFIEFFNKLPKKMNFEDAVIKGERSFTMYLKKKYSSDVLIHDFSTASSKCYLSGNRNPTVWPYSLLQQGFPLIKVKAMTGDYGNELMESRADVKEYLYYHNKELFKIVINDLSRRKKNECVDVLPDFDFNSSKFDLAIKNKKVVSFDIFDTLLIRPFTDPTDLFSFLEEKYKINGYKQERILAEKRARNLIKEEEVTINEIYEQILPKYQKMKSIELVWESKLLQVNPKIFQLYEQAVKNGKIVIATSDMYLEQEYLKKLLSDKGYKEISQVFVSSCYRKTKGTGNLYREIMRTLKISEKDIIHIGDNLIADVKIPQKLGIVSYHIHKILDDFLENPANAKFTAFSNIHHDLNSSIHLALVAHRTYKEKNDNLSYWNMMGYRFAGPLALGYLNFIYSELQQNHIDKVLFVARDGWALKKIYDKYYYPNTKIKSGYIYLQRILGIKGLLTWCKNPEYLKILLKNAKKDIPEIVVSKNYKENIKEYKRYYKDLKKWSQDLHDELYSHIYKNAGDNQNIAIVDMTTGAFSSYHFSKKILKERMKLALYTGTFKCNPDFHYLTFAKREFTSNDDLLLKLSELLLSSVEPLVVGLKDGKPVYSAEHGIRTQIYPEIYAGMEEYVKTYLDLFGVTDTIMNNMEEWIEMAKFYFAYSNEIDNDFMKKIYETGLPGIDNTVRSMYDIANNQ